VNLKVKDLNALSKTKDEKIKGLNEQIE